jgi:guanylate kinase
MTQGKGYLFIISAPSGAGKTTLCKALLARFQDMCYSVSYTTRKPRTGERTGVEYHFISKEDFIKGIETGKWAEWAEVHGNYYGTSAAFLDEKLSQGKDILMDIDVQGTIQIIKRYAHALTFFIKPPSLNILKSRLESRGTENPEAISKRLNAAKNEMEKMSFYRHVVVNDELPKAVSELAAIIETYRSKRR